MSRTGFFANAGQLSPKLWVGVLMLLFAAGTSAAVTPAIDLYVAEAPPLSMVSQGERHGIVGDVAIKAAALAGYELQLISLPWLRAQHDVRAGSDRLIVPLSRTPERENNYAWIAPVMTMDRAFFSLNQRVESFAEAKKAYGLIAVGMGSAQEQKLRDEGFRDDQIYPLKIGDNPAQMLLRGRVDAWFNGVPESQYIWRQLSNRPLKMSPPLMRADLYLACSKVCNQAMIDALSGAVEDLRRDGTISLIIMDYLKGLPLR
ncbi:substrate-binding periplasmic protein [Pseudomonas huanghezhanensis]|uniref:substrate-binding periplasmic protein n=1 Tax=Pseudomonas huanghezhanensis TaxID=3002903 RepID=UPI002285449F|nr:transporter substrate-binding domain-containing protein [Pseudomonas sp. BSw22131]